MSIELKIRSLLNETDDVTKTVETLLLKAANRKARTADIEAITQFVIAAGMYEDAFRQFPRRFYERDKIPWPQFIRLLSLNDVEVDDKVMQACIEGAKKKDKFDNLVMARDWDHKCIAIVNRRRELFKEKNLELEQKKASLIQKLQFLKNHRIIDEENKAYKKYLEMFPDDDSIKKEYLNFQERWAREIIHNRSEQKKVNKSYESYKVPTHSQDEIELLDTIYEECKKISQNNPKSNYDFAMLFFFIDFHSAAKRCLEDSLKNNNAKWLYAEVLYLNEDYLELLSYLEDLMKEFEADPETQFAISFLRAKAYSQLGHYSEAISILNKIIELRPNYRSAQSLVAEWSQNLGGE